MAEHQCSVCLRPVDPRAAMGEEDSGGYVPMQFPNEASIEVWIHHRCLLNDDRSTQNGRPAEGVATESDRARR